MSGVTEDNQGHAWVIDGYKICTRRVIYTTNYYVLSADLSGKRILHHSESKEGVETRNLVHCNWGWKDNMDIGWFLPYLFDPDDAEEWEDPKNQVLKPTYNRKLKMIKNIRYAGTK